jgi:hypothetical protein
MKCNRIEKFKHRIRQASVLPVTLYAPFHTIHSPLFTSNHFVSIPFPASSLWSRLFSPAFRSISTLSSPLWRNGTPLHTPQPPASSLWARHMDRDRDTDVIFRSKKTNLQAQHGSQDLTDPLAAPQSAAKDLTQSFNLFNWSRSQAQLQTTKLRATTKSCQLVDDDDDNKW